MWAEGLVHIQDITSRNRLEPLAETFISHNPSKVEHKSLYHEIAKQYNMVMLPAESRQGKRKFKVEVKKSKKYQVHSGTTLRRGTG